MKTPYINLREKQVFCIMMVLVIMFSLLYCNNAHAQEFLLPAVAVSISDSIDTGLIAQKPAATLDGNQGIPIACMIIPDCGHRVQYRFPGKPC